LRRSRITFGIAPESVRGRSTFTFAVEKTFLFLAFLYVSSEIAFAALDTAKIDEITGLKGKLNEKEGVYKVTYPRSDVKVAVDGWTMPPFMGLGRRCAEIWVTPSFRRRAQRWLCCRRESELFWALSVSGP
jgi:hypothetical protein